MTTKETYKGLKTLLDMEKFPKPYVFKFIIPTGQEKEDQVRACFESTSKITLTYSKTKKYTTLTILDRMESSDAIIKKYLLVSEIENVIHI